MRPGPPKPPKKIKPAIEYLAAGKLADTTIAKLAKQVRDIGMGDKISYNLLDLPALKEAFKAFEAIKNPKCFLIPRGMTLVLLGTVEEIVQDITKLNEKFVAISVTDAKDEVIVTPSSMRSNPEAVRIGACWTRIADTKGVLLAIGERRLFAEAWEWRQLSLAEKHGVVSHLWLDDDFKRVLTVDLSKDFGIKEDVVQTFDAHDDL